METFKRGDKARVILGSSKDQKRGDLVIIEEIYSVGNYLKVDCKTIKTNHKFWCKYSDLLTVNK